MLPPPACNRKDRNTESVPSYQFQVDHDDTRITLTLGAQCFRQNGGPSSGLLAIQSGGEVQHMCACGAYRSVERVSVPTAAKFSAEETGIYEFLWTTRRGVFCARGGGVELNLAPRYAVSVIGRRRDKQS